jgi:hypothetical protein
VLAVPERLRVQVVVYDIDAPTVHRLGASVARALHLARDAGVIDSASFVIGDCSAEPTLGSDDLLVLADQCAKEDVDALEYRFFGENRFHSGGHNALAADGDEDWLLVLNPECYLAPDAITAMLAGGQDESVAAVEARQVPLEHPKAYDADTLDTSWGAGACLLVRRAPFAAVDGFDAEHFPMYCNDVDLSWRLRLAGGRVRFAPGAAVFHDKRVDAATGYPVPTVLEEHSGLLARLLLTTRYARPDLCDETIALVREHGSPAQRRAVDDFERRRAEGRIPAALPDAATVADFVAGDYGLRRF